MTIHDNLVINITDPKLDNAQYLMLMLQDKFTPEEMSKSKLSGYMEEYGVLLGTIEVMGKEFQLFISGSPVITKPNGEAITVPTQLKQYLLNNKSDELFVVNPAYIQVIEIDNKDRFYGVYYSVSDAVCGIKKELEIMSV